LPDGAPAVGGKLKADGDDESEAVVIQAAKALKTAVLHDARNIEGKAADAGALLWDVTSSREAKVRSHVVLRISGWSDG